MIHLSLKPIDKEDSVVFVGSSWPCADMYVMPLEILCVPQLVSLCCSRKAQVLRQIYQPCMAVSYLRASEMVLDTYVWATESHPHCLDSQWLKLLFRHLSHREEGTFGTPNVGVLISN